jgi:hypothetical protein
METLKLSHGALGTGNIFLKSVVYSACAHVLTTRIYLFLIVYINFCRVGVASFISLLVQNVGADIRPYTNMLLRLLFPVVKEDKSVAAKRSFANACALVLKHATPLQAEKLIEETAALHTGDRNDQMSCAILLKSYSSMASDVVSGYHAVLVPVIFVSRSESGIWFF